MKVLILGAHGYLGPHVVKALEPHYQLRLTDIKPIETKHEAMQVDVSSLDEVMKAAKHPLTVCDEGSPTIASLKATVSVLDLLVSNDSGPRHVAVAFNKPVICIMGPTAPVYTEGPYERGRVLRVDVDCGPCQKPVCATDHRCMLNIGPDNVLEAALEYLPKAKV